MKKQQPHYSFNVILLGGFQVGKTAICHRFCHDVYEAANLKVTYGVTFMVREIELDGHRITLNIRDTAGDERYRSLMKMYYNEVHGVIMVYDITSKISLDKLKFWADDLEINGNSMECRALVGNKKDLAESRQAALFDGLFMAKMNDMDWCECSAKTGEGVSSVFETLARSMMERYHENPDYRRIGHDSSACVSLSDGDLPPNKKRRQSGESGCC